MLSGMVSCGAANGIGEVMRTSVETLPVAPSGPLADPDVTKALQAMAESQFRALRGMKGSRIAIQLGLSLCCGLALVSGLRLLRPVDVPREAVRRLIAFSATGCAILRTLDGAQLAVAYKRAGAAFAQSASDLPAQMPDELLGTFLVAASTVWTALLAGAFALLAGYFSSARVREWVARADQQQSVSR